MNIFEYFFGGTKSPFKKPVKKPVKTRPPKGKGCSKLRKNKSPYCHENELCKWSKSESRCKLKKSQYKSPLKKNRFDSMNEKTLMVVLSNLEYDNIIKLSITHKRISEFLKTKKGKELFENKLPKLSNFYNISKEINPTYRRLKFIDRHAVDVEKVHQNVELFIKDNTKPGDILFIGDTYESRQEYGYLIVVDNVTGKYITDNGFQGLFSDSKEEFVKYAEEIYNDRNFRIRSGLSPVPEMKVDFTDVMNYIYENWDGGRIYSYINGKTQTHLPKFKKGIFGKGYLGWVDPRFEEDDDDD